jgi:hypothetical protein
MALTEGKYTAEFLISEAPGALSRDNATITVAASTKLSPGHVLALVGSGYVEYDNAGTDGSQTAAGILYAEVDNTDGGSPADFDGVVINLNAEVKLAVLGWFSGASAGDKTAALADLLALGIKAR